MTGFCHLSATRTTMSFGPRLLAQGKKLVCVGRNFADHAKELGNAVPTTPLLFLKPTSSYITMGQGDDHCIQIPRGCTNLHHEVELGVVIGKRARDISGAEADSHIAGYIVALDMTARELQEQAKKAGLPWSVAKGQDTFTPISDMIPKASLPRLDQVELWCKVNGVEKQRGSTSMMIFPVLELIAHISTLFTLEVGDVVLTGMCCYSSFYMVIYSCCQLCAIAYNRVLQCEILMCMYIWRAVIPQVTLF